MAETTPRTAPGQRLTVAEAGAHYLRHLEARGRKKSTRTGVESAIRVHLDPFFGEKSIGSVRASDVEDLMVVMRRRGVGPKSIRNYIGTLSAIFNFAAAPRRAWVASNPARGVELPDKVTNEDIRFLDPDEVVLLCSSAVPGLYERIDRALYVTAAMTGLRQGELIALRWRDVDWSAARVRVRQNYVLNEFGTPKSKRSTRSVPMADRVAAELERLYQWSAAQSDDDLVFADPHTGRPLSKAANLRRYRKALRAAGLDESHTLHHLRHTFGSAMAAAGVPMRTLQEWMGHRDITTTQIYADYSPSTREAAYVEAAFGVDMPSGSGTSRSAVPSP